MYYGGRKNYGGNFPKRKEVKALEGNWARKESEVEIFCFSV